MLLRRSIERGLTAADFEFMTVGMIIDYLIDYQNEEYEQRSSKGNARMATQNDIDAF